MKVWGPAGVGEDMRAHRSAAAQVLGERSDVSRAEALHCNGRAGLADTEKSGTDEDRFLNLNQTACEGEKLLDVWISFTCRSISFRGPAAGPLAASCITLSARSNGQREHEIDYHKNGDEPHSTVASREAVEEFLK